MLAGAGKYAIVPTIARMTTHPIARLAIAPMTTPMIPRIADSVRNILHISERGVPMTSLLMAQAGVPWQDAPGRGHRTLMPDLQG